MVSDARTADDDDDVALCLSSRAMLAIACSRTDDVEAASSGSRSDQDDDDDDFDPITGEIDLPLREQVTSLLQPVWSHRRETDIYTKQSRMPATPQVDHVVVRFETGGICVSVRPPR